MTGKQLEIEEYQVNQKLPKPKLRSLEYVYLGYNKKRYLHQFILQGYLEQGDHTKVELFAKRKSPPASWHLRRGAWCYEFVSSI